MTGRLNSAYVLKNEFSSLRGLILGPFTVIFLDVPNFSENFTIILDYLFPVNIYDFFSEQSLLSSTKHTLANMTFYDTENQDKNCAKFYTFSRLHGISVNNTKHRRL